MTAKKYRDSLRIYFTRQAVGRAGWLARIFRTAADAATKDQTNYFSREAAKLAKENLLRFLCFAASRDPKIVAAGKLGAC
ncbi:MAG: hypothetical protein ACREH8_15315, partial [Opitutaceae bacterium]